MVHARPMRHALHLDFHTLPEVTGIGERFDPSVFGDGLRDAGIGYVNVFAKCNLGFAYYPTSVGIPHPHLTRDLLGEMVESCHDRDIGVTAYLSLGLDHEAVRRHREWASVDATGRIIQEDRSGNFFRVPCYRSGYGDHFVAMVEEVLGRYPVDGIFCDNMGVYPCYGDECLAEIRARGEDPLDPAVVADAADRARFELARRVKQVVGEDRYLIFNGLPYWQARELNTHMEVECLPARWGFDFLEPTAALARTIYPEVLYMTGRFQHSWGDFGGYKGLASLRHDLADAMALGMEFSVGDHLLPDGRIEPLLLADLATLHRETVELRDQLQGQRHLADTAVLVGEDARGAGPVLRGLGEMFAELSVSYDVLTTGQDVSPYELVVVPDDTVIDETVASILNDHIDAGGAVLAVGPHQLAGDRWPMTTGERLGADCFYQRAGLAGPAAEMRWSTYAPAVLATAAPEAGVVASLVRPSFANTYDGFHGHFYIPPADPRAGEVAAAVRGRVAQVGFGAFEGFHAAASPAHVALVGALLERIHPDRLLRRGPRVPPVVKLDLADGPTGSRYRRFLHVRTGRATPRGELAVVLDPGALAAGSTVAVQGRYTSARVLPDGGELEIRPDPQGTTVVLPEVIGHLVVGLAG